MPSDSKTEKATPKKREDERKKGNLFQSRDVVSALSILVIFSVLRLILPYAYQYLSNLMRHYFGYAGTMRTLPADAAMDIYKDGAVSLILLAGPVMLSSLVVSIVATGAQTKFKFSQEQIKLKFSRLNPITGLKRLFSVRSVVELAKSSAKIAIIGAVLYMQFQKIAGSFLKLLNGGVMQGVVFILNTVMDIVIRLSAVFFAIALFDYLYQWWEYEKNIRMSKQEIKEEYKQLEGNPEIKGKIRERQRKTSMRRMMQKVPTADVVVRNPTHFAVALKYDIDRDNAPLVVAKGQDYIALKIIAIAEKHNIPMQENKALARAMYDAAEVGREIPPLFYAAVAEIMAWVYTMKKETE